MINISRESEDRLFAAATAAARNAGDLAQAAGLYQQLLAANPRHAAALHGLGVVYRDAGQPDAAMTAFSQSQACGNHEAALFTDAGRTLLHLGKYGEAAPLFRQALKLGPANAEALNDLAVVLGFTQQHSEAKAVFEQAIGLAPNYVPALSNYAGFLRGQGRLAEAVALFERAIAVDASYAAVYNNMAESLLMMGRVGEALAAYQRAMALGPDMTIIRHGYLYALNLVEQADPLHIYNEHRRWDRELGAPLANGVPPHANDRSPERRLRVGYVSADFRVHSVAFFIESLLQHHDRNAVEVFCYANPVPEDRMTQRLRAMADHWRPTHGMPDERLAALIREDAIDILVDLHGHTTGSRLLALARKPAPVQVTYLGYPATTGLAAMGYRLTDAHADPVAPFAPGMPAADEIHSERLVRLPETFLCWQPPAESPPPVPAAMTRRRFTFASFNALPKVSARTIKLWAEILRRMPESMLLIKAVGLGDLGTRELLLKKFVAEGIGSDRLHLVDRIADLANHLELYQQVDVALDTSPYNGTTTTCEALWMGVPVVTLAGHAHAGRVGVSLLTNAGLADLVATNAEAYVERALAMAADEGRREALRQRLRETMRASPLMNAERFARNVEQAYREMWRAWCATGV